MRQYKQLFVNYLYLPVSHIYLNPRKYKPNSYKNQNYGNPIILSLNELLISEGSTFCINFVNLCVFFTTI